jgi:long-chain acyl-CoA synthetase
MLTQTAQRHGSHTAFVYGSERINYREFHERVRALAAAFREMGLQRGDRVAVLMWNCPELLESYYAIWRAGGCVVPLNARFRAEEITYHVNDSRCSILVLGEEFQDVVADLVARLGCVRHFIVTGSPRWRFTPYHQLLHRWMGTDVAEVPVSDDCLAWLFYTSGTTGRPKGAVLTHGNLTFVSVAWVADLMHLEPEDIAIHAAPLTHGAGFHALALTMKGCTQVILGGRRFDPELFCSTVSQHRVTNTWLVPTQIKMLLRYPGLDQWDLSSLRWVVYGGAPMYAGDMKEALHRIGPVFVQLFGQGETPMTATYLRREEHVADGPGSERLSSCGHARSGIEIRIMGAADEEVGLGAVGEICVRGPSVMKGYWERPEATVEALRGGWLHTGDLGSVDEQGYVYVLDRSKDMIISGGENVYPREIEEVLLTHHCVAEACVIGVPDEMWGEAVKALIVLKPGRCASAEEIKSFVAARIADYKKPKSVDFVDELAKNAYGKLLRREIRSRYWAGHTRQV